MVLKGERQPLQLEKRSIPKPGPGEILIRVSACAICRTDLHLVDGELPNIQYPIVPGHEIVGRAIAWGDAVVIEEGTRLGVPWLGYSCGRCPYCREQKENLCDNVAQDSVAEKFEAFVVFFGETLVGQRLFEKRAVTEFIVKNSFEAGERLSLTDTRSAH